MELPVPQNHQELKRCLGTFAYARWIKNYSGKVNPLTIKSVAFPLSHDALAAFEQLRSELLNACLGCIGKREPFAVECDASDFAIAATSIRTAGQLHLCLGPCLKQNAIIRMQKKKPLRLLKLFGSGAIFCMVNRSHL